MAKRQRIPPVIGTPLHEDSIVHGKSSDLELLNAEETVFLATTVPLLLRVVLPSCVSQYLRQWEAFEVADDSLKVASKVTPACS